VAIYKLAPQVETDLLRIWVFGAERFGERQADIFYWGLFNQFQLIADNPQHFQKVDHIKLGYRRCVFKSHSVYYRVKTDFVEIMTIIYQQEI